MDFSGGEGVGVLKPIPSRVLSCSCSLKVETDRFHFFVFLQIPSSTFVINIRWLGTMLILVRVS